VDGVVTPRPNVGHDWQRLGAVDVQLRKEDFLSRHLKPTSDDLEALFRGAMPDRLRASATGATGPPF